MTMLTGFTPRSEPPSGGRHTPVLALLAFAMLIVSLDQYIVVERLPCCWLSR